jgi:hypothetical protein
MKNRSARFAGEKLLCAEGAGRFLEIGISRFPERTISLCVLHCLSGEYVFLIWMPFELKS